MWIFIEETEKLRNTKYFFGALAVQFLSRFGILNLQDGKARICNMPMALLSRFSRPAPQDFFKYLVCMASRYGNDHVLPKLEDLETRCRWEGREWMRQ